MINKLRRRLICIAMLSVTLVLVLMIGAVNVFNYASTRAELDRLLTLISDNAGTIPKHPELGRPGRGEGGRFTAETPFSTRYFVLVYSREGELLTANFEHIAAVGEGDAAVYLAAAIRHGVGTGRQGAYLYRVTALEGDRYMAVFLDGQNELSAIRTYAVGSAVVGLSGILLIYLLILVFSKQAIDPAVQSMEKQKRFITDAGHELKTPLTVICTSQKVLEMEVGPQKWIDKTLAQADKMRELVDELVTLSRLDEERPPLQLSWFNASEAVGETAESFRDFAAAKGHPLELDIPPDVRFCGDQWSLRRLASVLVDNAVKYAAEGGAIRLSLSQTKKGIVLTVSNPCQPMDRSELDRLFDRFYRVDKSRSRQTGGFGLGLSIARGIVETHHGSIRAACPDERTIQFVAVLNHMRLPRGQSGGQTP